MSDCIIDTNVLLVASAHYAGLQPDKDRRTLFMDSDHVPIEQREIVFNWLVEFRGSPERKIVLDQSFKIWDEYHNQMTRGQDFGSLVATEKLQSARFVEVEYDKHGYGCLPPELEKVIHDRSDRKFVAAALSDLENGDQCSIINAVDSDWREWENALRRSGIVLEHLVNDVRELKRAGKAKR